jgi:hypothetical protein
MGVRGFAPSHSLVAMALTALVACGTGVDRLEPQRLLEGEGGAAPHHVESIDLLIVIDNSPGMADAQALLALTVPHLVGALAEAGIVDAHIGVISSSLGSHGSDTCLADLEPSENDAAQLLDRTVDGGAIATWNDLGFLVWDPDPDASRHAPPGTSDPLALGADLAALVLGAGDRGCGFQAPLEAWYRFLIDPDPYETIAVEKSTAVMKGTDTVLLAQRRRFLRPSSLLAVIMLSDENDCSVRDGGQYYFAAQQSAPGTSTPYHLPRPRPECAIDPSVHCCRSCGQSQDGCPDATAHCDENGDGKVDTIDPVDDPHALRCFDQKRRFGIDFLYPIDRYVDGLSLPAVYDRNGNIQNNALFNDLDPTDAFSGIRSPDMIFVAGIVGVPWENVTRMREPARAATAAALSAIGAWTELIGDPAAFVPPTDPHMIESTDPRPGLPTASMPLADPIHGHDVVYPERDALQFACIFDLFSPRDCASSDAPCPCIGDDSPLCYDAVAGVFDTVQRRGGARPGIRQLQLLQAMGQQAVVGSVCPATLDEAASAFAYRPVVRTMFLLFAPYLD